MRRSPQLSKISTYNCLIRKTRDLKRSQATVSMTIFMRTTVTKTLKKKNHRNPRRIRHN